MSNALPQSRLRVQRIAEAAVERARLTVVPRRRVQAPKVPFVMLVSAVLLAGVIGLLMFNTSMQRHAFTVSELEAQASGLRAEEQGLRAEIEELRDPQTIGDQAQRMGMVLPGAPAFLQLDADGGHLTRGSGESVAGVPFSATLPEQAKPKELVPDTRVITVQQPVVPTPAAGTQPTPAP